MFRHFAAAIALLMPVAAAFAQFTTIADTNTAIPNGTGNFASFPAAPAIDGGQIAFVGDDSNGHSGVYRFAGAVRLVADSSTKTQGGGDLVSAPGDPCIGGTNVAFFATTTQSQQGIYASIGNTLDTVADNSTQAPNGDKSTFTAFSSIPSISQSTVAFAASSATVGGVYTFTAGNSGLVTIADNTTPIPASSGNFNFTNGAPPNPCISGSNIAFVGSGSGGQQGIYLSSGGSLSRIADTNTAVPGGSGNFINFSAYPGLSGSNIVFDAEGASNQQGYYASIGGQLLTIADTHTAIPGGSGDFLFNAHPSDPCIDGSNVLIEERGSGGQEGIYFWSDGSLSKVVDLTDLIDGKTIESLGMGREALSGDMVVFSAEFTDGSAGIFETSVPEPGTLAILCLAAPLAGRGRRRK